MKKLSLITAILAVVLIGCSDQSSVVGPAKTPGLTEGATVEKVNAKASQATSNDAPTKPDTSPITISQKVVASQGGTVTLSGSFTNAALEKVGYLLSITFKAGDLPSDQTISITINPATFAQTADVQFGPEGLVFKNPATLYLFGTNVDIAKQSSSVYLTYYNNGTWVKMPSSWGYYTSNFSGVVLASGQIPHFSRYAFGR